MAAKGMVAASLYEGQVGAAVAGAGEDVVGGTEVEMEMEAAVGAEASEVEEVAPGACLPE